MGSAKLLRDAIIALLEAGNPKNSAGKAIVAWKKAEPPKNQYGNFPFAWVVWTGGPVIPSSMSVRKLVTDNFFIVVADKYPAGDKVEDSMLSFYDSITDVLEADPTLSGTVATSWISNREVDRVWLADYSAAALRITLTCMKRE